MTEGNYDVTVRWTILEGNIRVPVFRDTSLFIHEAFTDYCLEIARSYVGNEGGLKSLMDSVVRALKSLLIFLERGGYANGGRISWLSINDDFLKEFMKWELARIQADPRSRSERTSKRTVNGLLRRIYHFYLWAQNNLTTERKLIGWSDCQIRSSLPDIESGKSKPKSERMYPCQFKRVGEGSRTSDLQYWATDDDLRDLVYYFESSCIESVTVRNILILHLIEAVGWRRGSAASLTIDLFADEAIKRAIDARYEGVPIRPSNQKGGMEYSFFVPFDLAMEVNRYIKDGRNKILAHLGIDERVAKHRLFISVTTGAPLTEGTLSDEIGVAFRAIGAPKGAGPHSIRRKFYLDANRREITRRMQIGLPVGAEEVALTLSQKMGHSSPTSQSAYRKAVSGLSVNSETARQQLEIAALRSENLELRSKIASLERLITDSDARGHPKRKH